MKKIIWLSFAVLAALLTGFVMVARQLAGWALSTVSSLQMPNVVNEATQFALPDWLSPWIDSAWLQAMKSALVGTVQGLNGILPAAASIDAWIAAFIWLGWGVGMVALLALAAGLHWFTGRSAPRLPA